MKKSIKMNSKRFVSKFKYVSILLVFLIPFGCFHIYVLMKQIRVENEKLSLSRQRMISLNQLRASIQMEIHDTYDMIIEKRYSKRIEGSKSQVSSNFIAIKELFSYFESRFPDKVENQNHDYETLKVLEEKYRNLSHSIEYLGGHIDAHLSHQEALEIKDKLHHLMYEEIVLSISHLIKHDMDYLRETEDQVAKDLACMQNYLTVILTGFFLLLIQMLLFYLKSLSFWLKVNGPSTSTRRDVRNNEKSQKNL